MMSALDPTQAQSVNIRDDDATSSQKRCPHSPGVCLLTLSCLLSNLFPSWMLIIRNSMCLNLAAKEEEMDTAKWGRRKCTDKPSEAQKPSAKLPA